MKKNISIKPFTYTAALAAGCLLGASHLFADQAQEMTGQQFPQVIPYELGASGFAAGDQITITSVRGNREHIEPGGSYLVEGTYTLASADGASLALFCTTRGPSGPTPIQDGQRIKITTGTGKFSLYETNVPDGWLHVSFYPHHSDWHGGVYFGEKGKESSVMRNQSWFEKPAAESTGTQSDTGGGLTSKANRALIAYLGDPVAPPAGMDPRYNREHLLKAFSNLCQNAGWVTTRLAVDDSEFPFLVYGTLDGAHKLPEKPVFEEQKGYTYSGSVTGNNGEGSTYFAVSMVPTSQYPTGQEDACSRRLLIRLEMLSDKAQQAQ